MTVALNRARTFVENVVRPSVAQWDAEARYPRAAVAKSGLTGMFVAKDKGGLGLSYQSAVDVFEMLGRGDGSLAFSMSMHNAVAAAVNGAGTGEVLERWGLALAKGKALGCFSLTEPHAGSDATAIVTTATRKGRNWKISGRKAWVTLGGEADVYAVVAKTSDKPGHKDIAMFVVAADAPGVSFTEPYSKGASAFLPITDMILEDAPAHLLVPPGAGMAAALAAIDVARFDIAAISNGILAECLDVAVKYASERMTFGKPIIEHQGLAWQLADVATDLAAGRGLVRAAAEALAAGNGRVPVAHAKRFCPDAAVRGAVTCGKALGANGWRDDYGITRMLAVASMMPAVDGTAEVQRIVIARDLAKNASA